MFKAIAGVPKSFVAIASFILVMGLVVWGSGCDSGGSHDRSEAVGPECDIDGLLGDQVGGKSLRSWHLDAVDSDFKLVQAALCTRSVLGPDRLDCIGEVLRRSFASHPRKLVSLCEIDTLAAPQLRDSLHQYLGSQNAPALRLMTARVIIQYLPADSVSALATIRDVLRMEELMDTRTWDQLHRLLIHTQAPDGVLVDSLLGRLEAVDSETDFTVLAHLERWTSSMTNAQRERFEDQYARRHSGPAFVDTGGR